MLILTLRNTHPHPHFLIHHPDCPHHRNFHNEIILIKGGMDGGGVESKFVWHYSNSGHIFRLSTHQKLSPLLQPPSLPPSFHFYQLCLIAARFYRLPSNFLGSDLFQSEIWMWKLGRSELAQSLLELAKSAISGCSSWDLYFSQKKCF